jgi:RNA polymerase sigma-70 factor (ECF subfamily)
MEAEDLHQIGWMRTFDKLDAWKNNGPFRAWLRKLFLNVCIKAFQKSKRRSTWMGTASEQAMLDYPDTATNLDFAEEALLVKWISALPGDVRLVFNLFAIEGYNHEEIADLLSISVANSRQQLHRARKQLAYLYHQSLKERGLPAID